MTKQCRKCKETKELSNFYDHPIHKGKKRSYCMSCMSNDMKKYNNINKSQLRQKKKEWKAANYDKNRNTRLKCDYGVDSIQYEAMLMSQGLVCAICKQPETYVNSYGDLLPLCVDHCHKTNKIRGLLCNNCNRAIGYLKDNPTYCNSAATYLLTYTNDTI